MRRALVAAVAAALATSIPACTPSEQVAVPATPTAFPTARETAGEEPTVRPAWCLRLRPSWVPRDLTDVTTVAVPQGEEHLGERVTYANEDLTREFSVLSGIAGEVGAGMSHEPEADVALRGHDARVLRDGDSVVVVWEERPPGEPCAQYAVVATGLSPREFERALGSLDEWLPADS